VLCTSSTNTQTRSLTWCVHRISHRDINSDRILRASFIARHHTSRGIFHCVVFSSRGIIAASSSSGIIHRTASSSCGILYRAASSSCALSIARYHHRAASSSCGIIHCTVSSSHSIIHRSVSSISRYHSSRTAAAYQFASPSALAFSTRRCTSPPPLTSASCTPAARPSP
jgi:hypothetical protein